MYKFLIFFWMVLPFFSGAELGAYLGTLAGNEVEVSLHARLSAVASSHKYIYKADLWVYAMLQALLNPCDFRTINAATMTMVTNAAKVCEQMQTFLDKAIPDAKYTQNQYERARADYLVRRQFEVVLWPT